MSRPRRRRPSTPRAGAPTTAAAPSNNGSPAPARGSNSNNGGGTRRGGRPQTQPKTTRGLDRAAAETLTTPAATVRPTDAADAVVRSLGAPPLPGHEVAAEHYFAAVYERSVALATALASAAGLLDEGDDHDSE